MIILVVNSLACNSSTKFRHGAQHEIRRDLCYLRRADDDRPVVIFPARWTGSRDSNRAGQAGFPPGRGTSHRFGLADSRTGLLRGKAWAVKSFLVFGGMLLYSVIVSPGYFAQQGQWIFVGMFAVLLALALWSMSQLRRA
jgi:hypothetical protein